ncbi:rCG63279 [Rattus norvegicus]|uniref:RCG63279 n=1 Tax=Rattus norvegicus TaxID=10116 RepID=A6J557_RAT|nr:rCG63279 [Rattus norvegicus]
MAHICNMEGDAGHHPLDGVTRRCQTPCTTSVFTQKPTWTWSRQEHLIFENRPILPDLPSQFLKDWSPCQLKYCIWLGERKPQAQNGSQIIPQILLI